MSLIRRAECSELILYSCASRAELDCPQHVFERWNYAGILKVLAVPVEYPVDLILVHVSKVSNNCLACGLELRRAGLTPWNQIGQQRNRCARQVSTLSQGQSCSNAAHVAVLDLLGQREWVVG